MCFCRWTDWFCFWYLSARLFNKTTNCCKTYGRNFHFFCCWYCWMYLFVMRRNSQVTAKKAGSTGQQLSDKQAIVPPLILPGETWTSFWAQPRRDSRSISILTGVYSGEKLERPASSSFWETDSLKPYADTIATSIVVIIVTISFHHFRGTGYRKIWTDQGWKIARIVAGPMNVLFYNQCILCLVSPASPNPIFKILIYISKANDSSVTEEEIKAMITEGSEHWNDRRRWRDHWKSISPRATGTLHHDTQNRYCFGWTWMIL